jgi:hypothetical protein
MRWIAFLVSLAALAQTSPKAVDVNGRDLWVDTGIDVRAGDELVLKATGILSLSDGTKITPAGGRRGWRDLLRSYPVNSAAPWSVIGRLGSNGAAQPFLVGENLHWTAPRDGRLFLGINKSGTETAGGTFQATVEFANRAPETVSKTDYKLPEVTVDLLDRIPRRVVDADGNLGDNTNFLIIGSEQQILNAFRASGWVEVDRNPNDAVLNGIIAVLNKEAYLKLPMSELTLFGRVQDYGLAHAEPIAVVAERHHFRLWKAPFDLDGQEVWVGAGTHDIGFDRDQRNNGVTHKIDPVIDKEREFIAASLEESGMVAKISYVTPSQPSIEALTATGASFRSDGRVLIVHMTPEPATNVPDAAVESIFVNPPRP